MMVISFLLLCCLGVATPFRINCRTPLTKLSAPDLKSPPTKLRRCERISVYHHPDGVNNPDPAPIEDVNALKTPKLTAVNQKTVLSVVAVRCISRYFWCLEFRRIISSRKVFIKDRIVGIIGLLLLRCGTSTKHFAFCNIMGLIIRR
jgi:hypothetical protein